MLLRFLGSLISNLMLDLENSKWPIKYGGPKSSNYQFSLTYPNTTIFCNFFTLNFLCLIKYIKIEFSNFKKLKYEESDQVLNIFDNFGLPYWIRNLNFENPTSDLKSAIPET